MRVVIVATEAGLFPIDKMMADLEQLAQLATVVINEHTNDEGLCSVCLGVAFPCASVALAERSVAYLPVPQVGRTGR